MGGGCVPPGSAGGSANEAAHDWHGERRRRAMQRESLLERWADARTLERPAPSARRWVSLVRAGPGRGSPGCAPSSRSRSFGGWGRIRVPPGHRSCWKNALWVPSVALRAF